MSPPPTQPPWSSGHNDVPQLSTAVSVQGGHGVPCTSPFPAPCPFPVQGQLLRALQGAQHLCQALPWRSAVLQQLGWLHSQLRFGSGSATSGNSSRSHPGAAGSCILGKRGKNPNKPAREQSWGSSAVATCVSVHGGVTSGCYSPCRTLCWLVKQSP